MDKHLIDWLNSNPRNYLQGVDIYKRLGDSPTQLHYFLQGQSTISANKLFEALRDIYYAIKQGNKPTDPVMQPRTPKPKAEPSAPANKPLLEACKADADKHFKELMNVRALLFQLCPDEPEMDENSENAVRLRELYALQLLDMQPAHHEAYTTLRYVEQHGKLPDAPAEPKASELPSSPIELERMRTNLMKNISKLKRKEQTPERIALLQSHESKLQLIYNAIDQLTKK